MNAFPTLANSCFLITGGLGFVGSAIAARLLREGAKEVRVFDLKRVLPYWLENTSCRDRLQIFVGDIRNPDDVQKAMRGCDYVFHEAGLRVTQCAKDPRLAHEILVDGTFNVVQACVDQKIRKLIHASSAIVYGEPLRLPLDEQHVLHDSTLYGICKVANENLLRSFRQNFNLNYIALRYFNVYGAGMNLVGTEVEVLVRWLDRLDSGLRPVIYGDGMQTLDWINIEDVVSANLLAFQSGLSGEAFNVCTGRETSVLELLRILLGLYDSPLQPEFLEPRGVNQVPRRFGDPDKAARLLNFRAQMPLEKGLAAFLSWREEMLSRERAKKASITYSEK